jgi:hypothetical protein
MARKPNYGQQRAEVNRAKQAKQDAKQREREDAAARRRAVREGELEAPEEEPTADRPERPHE